jgi:Survival protein SurE
MGDDITYSGTVAAAMEGLLSGGLSLLPSVMILIDVARFRTPHLSSASDLLEVTVALAGVLVDLTPQPPWGPLHDSPDAPYAANEHSCISAPACSDNGLDPHPGVKPWPGAFSRC